MRLFLILFNMFEKPISALKYFLQDLRLTSHNVYDARSCVLCFIPLSLYTSLGIQYVLMCSTLTYFCIFQNALSLCEME